MDLKTMIIDYSASRRKKIKKKISLIFKGSLFLEAKDGYEGMEMLSTEDVELIILGLNMPKMNGLDFLKMAKANPFLRKIPIIILAAEGNSEYVKRACDLGVSGYLARPFDHIMLEEKIDNVMKKSVTR